jgi:hypothetical protein
VAAFTFEGAAEATDGSSRALNQAVGAIIDSGDTFATGESGSASHVGPAGDQFQLNAQGLLGFVMQTTTGGPLHFGCMRIVINNSGVGSIMDWAYDDSATSIHTGRTGTSLAQESFLCAGPSRNAPAPSQAVVKRAIGSRRACLASGPLQLWTAN